MLQQGLLRKLFVNTRLTYEVCHVTQTGTKSPGAMSPDRNLETFHSSCVCMCERLHAPGSKIQRDRFESRNFENPTDIKIRD